jgi:Xaa-Pro aminopeptidase
MIHQIPTSFFEQNRKRLSALLQSGSLAVLNSNHVLPTNADGTFKFKQNNDLFYLTGITQEETLLLLFPDHPDVSCREVLFIEQPNELRTKWDGHRHSKEEATRISGIKDVKYTSEFEAFFKAAAFRAERIYLNAIEHARATVAIQTRDDQFATWCKEHYKLHTYERLAPLMMQLRMIKNELEIELLRKSASITEKGFRRLLAFTKPGVSEKQLEAEMIHEYLSNGGDWADYSPIVASGADTCILHYNSNHKICKDGDLVLVDAAASFAGYNSDLTRTFPVNGRYTQRQKQVYNAVLRVHKAMRSLMKPGAIMKELQQHCFDLLTEELLQLGLFNAAELTSNGQGFYMNKYCYHNFSHFIGLDVHDIGDFYVPFQAGMALTNEPGIYIAEEGLGVRIENNLVITNNGNEDLMQNIPFEADEIEEIMNKGK